MVCYPELLSDVRNRFQFNGKENVSPAPDKLMLDYGAREYDPVLARWTTTDPLADMYVNISPYAFSNNNPVRYVDMNGMFYGDFYSKTGRYLGTDGIDDGKVYLIKTGKDSFKAEDNGNDPTAGAGIPKDELNRAIKFIRKNSGNSEMFADNPWVYGTFVGIEGSADARQGMFDIVSNDTSSRHHSNRNSNNMEHGGYVENGKVIQEASGPVGNPMINSEINMTFYGNGTTFHGHPSALIKNGDQWFFYEQKPSQTDLNNAGDGIHYVFGMRSGLVYVYNNQHIIATIPTSNFVNLKRK